MELDPFKSPAGVEGASSEDGFGDASSHRSISAQAWTRWNPGFHKGSLVVLALGARRGWFAAYGWVVRASADVSLLDPAPLEARLADARVRAVLWTCSRDGQEIRMPVPLQGGHVCADFLAFRGVPGIFGVQTRDV